MIAVLLVAFLVLGAFLFIYGISKNREGHAVAGVVLGFVSALLLGVTYPPGFDYSEGDRAGYVIKLSKKGVFWPTWEGEMQLGGFSMAQGGATSAATWDFSVSSDAIAKKLVAHMNAGTRCRVHYREKAMRGVSYGSTGYDIVEVGDGN